jgi:hypothetical protein
MMDTERRLCGEQTPQGICVEPWGTEHTHQDWPPTHRVAPQDHGCAYGCGPAIPGRGLCRECSEQLAAEQIEEQA